jgi:hypothetical protein
MTRRAIERGSAMVSTASHRAENDLNKRTRECPDSNHTSRYLHCRFMSSSTQEAPRVTLTQCKNKYTQHM